MDEWVPGAPVTSQCATETSAGLNKTLPFPAFLNKPSGKIQMGEFTLSCFLHSVFNFASFESHWEACWPHVFAHVAHDAVNVVLMPAGWPSCKGVSDSCSIYPFNLFDIWCKISETKSLSLCPERSSLSSSTNTSLTFDPLRWLDGINCQGWLNWTIPPGSFGWVEYLIALCRNAAIAFILLSQSLMETLKCTLQWSTSTRLHVCYGLQHLPATVGSCSTESVSHDVTSPGQILSFSVSFCKPIKSLVKLFCRFCWGFLFLCAAWGGTVPFISDLKLWFWRSKVAWLHCSFFYFFA